MKLKIIVVVLGLLLLGAGYIIAEDITKEATPETAAIKYCIVCGPEEEAEELLIAYKYHGKKYSFCSMECLKTFKKDPERFIKEEGKTTEKDKQTS